MEKKIPLCSVAQLCPTFCDAVDSSAPGSSVHGILQARILEQVAIFSPRGTPLMLIKKNAWISILILDKGLL